MLAYTDCSSIANCKANISSTFCGGFGIFRGIWKLPSIHSIVSRENLNDILCGSVSKHLYGYSGVIYAKVKFVSLKFHFVKFIFYVSESIPIHNLAFDGVIYFRLTGKRLIHARSQVEPANSKELNRGRCCS